MNDFRPQWNEPFLVSGNRINPTWLDYLRKLPPTQAVAVIEQQLAALGLRVAALEQQSGTTGNVVGRNSLVQYGRLADGTVYLELVGDEPTPDPLRYYGTDSDGERGFHAMPEPESEQLFQRMDTNGDFRITADGHLRVTN